MQSLLQGRIISAPSTWNSFIQGFCREPLAAATNSMNACLNSAKSSLSSTRQRRYLVSVT